jgi:hypothetical protein
MHDDDEVPAAPIPKKGNFNSGAKDDDNTTVIGSSPDEDDDRLPSYVPKHFKDDVGMVLDHKARLSNVKFGLTSHSIYPINRAEVASTSGFHHQ